MERSQNPVLALTILELEAHFSPWRMKSLRMLSTLAGSVRCLKSYELWCMIRKKICPILETLGRHCCYFSFDLLACAVRRGNDEPPLLGGAYITSRKLDQQWSYSCSKFAWWFHSGSWCSIPWWLHLTIVQWIAISTLEWLFCELRMEWFIHIQIAITDINRQDDPFVILCLHIAM